MTITKDHGPDELYDKFTVIRNSTQEKVDYFTFTLVPERDAWARTALVAYADACEGDYPELAGQIRAKLASLA